jgi:hypothetical protein
LTGVPTEYTSPPIRDGVPHTPKLIPRDPSPHQDLLVLFADNKKNDENRGKKALSEHFDNIKMMKIAAPHVIVFLLANLPYFESDGAVAVACVHAQVEL